MAREIRSEAKVGPGSIAWADVIRHLCLSDTGLLLGSHANAQIPDRHLKLEVDFVRGRGVAG
jgi:hypothetical protein